jgi:ABC-type nitrate/sulfonate/bicarbonate transport system substrate-binding protein
MRLSLAATTVLVAGVALAGCGSSTSSVSSAKNRPLTTVTLSLPAEVGGYLPFYLGIQKGFYRDVGINLDIQIIHPSIAVAEVRSGSLDLVGGVSEADTAALASGAPLREFAIFDERLDWVTVAPDSITSVHQLVGKTIAGESADSTDNLIEQKMLQASGIQLSQVSFINVAGSDAGRLALVEAGKASASAAEYSAYLAMPPGYHSIYDDSKFLGNYGGFAGSIDWARSHANLLRNLIAATAKATHYIVQHKSQTIAVIEKTFQLNKAKATLLWNFMKPDWAYGKPSSSAMKADLETDQSLLHLKDTPKVSQVADFSYVPAS